MGGLVKDLRQPNVPPKLMHVRRPNLTFGGRTLARSNKTFGGQRRSRSLSMFGGRTSLSAAEPGKRLLGLFFSKLNSFSFKTMKSVKTF
ncbi:hypothetical protein MANES_14G142601v8 [Manihot esculenta]|uniref:Uncharacterized protein n=1 Tax=Manihot esculenta TaxID=3983 RepID=A0ACB7GGQ1_MANES|nr:hypothetical protein MANES_14G142601v8 [Manihot esculenta]